MTVNVCPYCGTAPELCVIHNMFPFLKIKYMHERKKGYKLLCPKCFFSSSLVEPTINSAVFAWRIIVTSCIDTKDNSFDELCEVSFFG